jgi:hypothetical protein
VGRVGARDLAPHKWGYFPSGAVAWKLVRENFIEKMNLFDALERDQFHDRIATLGI